MELELHQLDLRYEALRSRSPARERQLLVSLTEHGQLTPVVVVAAAELGRHVVIDGHKRVRLLRRLRQDTVEATSWDLAEADALLFERMMRAGEGDSALEQGWFLRELRDRFGLSGEELARRFDRTPSWVSRRLSLVAELPEAVQRQVRAGAIGAHAAMKYLVPLARANAGDCVRLAEATAPLKPTSRQMATLYAAYLGGNVKTRSLLLEDPALVLRAYQATTSTAKTAAQTPARQVLGELGALGGIARRLYGRLRLGLLGGLLIPEREELAHVFGQARVETERLMRRLDKELKDAGREHPSRDSTAA